MNLLHFGALAVCTIGLVGCTSIDNPEGAPMPYLNYQHQDKVHVMVQDVVTEDVRSVRSGNYVPFVVSLEDTVRSYIDHHFVATGAGTETLRLIVKDITLERRFEESESGVGAFLGVAGQDVYTLRVQIHASLTDSAGNERGKIFTMGRELSISEHVSVAEREALQLKSVEGLMRSLDEALRESLRTEFGVVRLSGPEFR